MNYMFMYAVGRENLARFEFAKKCLKMQELCNRTAGNKTIIDSESSTFSHAYETVMCLRNIYELKVTQLLIYKITK